MKILSILLAILILVISLTACSSQPDSIQTFTEEGNPTLKAQILGIKLALQDLNTRLTELEENVLGEPYENPWNPQSIEARLKILEEKVLTSTTLPYPPYDPYFDKDKISKLERRVSALEQKLGISSWGW